MTATHRTHTRATNPPSPRQAESALDRLANAVIDTIAVEHADQAQAFLKAQAEVKPRAMVVDLAEARL